MNVALDSNILGQDFNLDGTQFRVFLSGLDLIPSKLFVPQVVIDETVTKFAEALTEQARAHERCLHNVNRLLPKSKRVHRLEININAESKSYRARLLKVSRHTVQRYFHTQRLPTRKLLLVSCSGSGHFGKTAEDTGTS